MSDGTVEYYNIFDNGRFFYEFNHQSEMLHDEDGSLILRKEHPQDMGCVNFEFMSKPLGCSSEMRNEFNSKYNFLYIISFLIKICISATCLPFMSHWYIGAQVMNYLGS